MSKDKKTDEVAKDSTNTSNLPAVKQDGDLFAQMLNDAEKMPHAQFKTIQDGTFIEFVEGEEMTLAFAGFEEVRDTKNKEKTQKACVFYNKEKQKLYGTHAVLVSKCEKISFTDAEGKPIQGKIVRVTMIGKPVGKDYFAFEVGVL